MSPDELNLIGGIAIMFAVLIISLSLKERE